MQCQYYYTKLKLMWNRIRTDIWEYEGVLQEYWSKGMIATGSPEQKALVNECTLLTGLNYVQIKVNCHSD